MTEPQQKSYVYSSYDYKDTEQLSRIWRVINKHKPDSEVLVLKWGSFILAPPAIFTGFLTQKFFNKCFKVGGRNWFTYSPMFLPGLGTTLVHKSIIDQEVLLESSACEGCTVFKSAALHLVSGVAWSFLLSSLGTCMIASLKKTMYVPPLEKYPLETLKLVGKQFRRFTPTAIAMCLGNCAYALVLTHVEIDQYKKMKTRLLIRLNSLDMEVKPEEFDELAS